MEEEILGLEDENSNLLDSSDGYDDYQEEGFDSDTPKGVLTEQEVRDNPFMSLVDYNINHVELQCHTLSQFHECYFHRSWQC